MAHPWRRRLVVAMPYNYGAAPRRRRRRQGSIRCVAARPASHRQRGGRPPGAWPSPGMGRAFRPLRVSPGAAATSPPARSARATRLFPGPDRPGPRLALCASRPPDRACDRRPPPAIRAGRAAARRAWGHREAHPPDPAARGRGFACRPRPVGSTEPTRVARIRAGPPRRGTGRRRMVHHQPRHRLIPAPATSLRRGPALPRRGAESAVP